MSDPEVTFTEDFYFFSFAPERATFMLERIEEKRGAGGGIVCELTVETTAPPSPGALSTGNWNLLTSHKALANDLTARMPSVDWFGLLTQVAGITKKRFREGAPILDLSTVASDASPVWLLKPLIDGEGVTVLAAGGGTGKSMLGLAVAASVATGLPIIGLTPTWQLPVLYMDWEASPDTHAQRLQAIWRGTGYEGGFPAGVVHYQRQVTSLRQSASHIRKRLVDLGIGFAVIDSVGLARGGAVEDSESTIQLFAAARSLAIPILAIDHMSKESLNKGGVKGPIGSVYTSTSARLVWTAQAAEQGDSMLLALENAKWNNVSKQKPLGWRVRVEADAEDRVQTITYQDADTRQMPSTVVSGGKKWEMIAYLREQHRPLTTFEIAAALSISAAQVRQLLSRHPQDFVRVGDGVGLAAQREGAPIQDGWSK